MFENYLRYKTGLNSLNVAGIVPATPLPHNGGKAVCKHIDTSTAKQDGILHLGLCNFIAFKEP